MGVQINGSEGNVIATKGTFSGDVGIGGTLTYEDVTNIDSVGLVTARSGIEIGARPGVAASISVDGNMVVSGITTIGDSSGGNEKLNVHGAIRSSASSANFNAGLEGTIMDYDIAGNAARFGHVNGASGSARDVIFLSGGAEKLRIASSGNVGLKTDSPAHALDIQGSSASFTKIALSNQTMNTSKYEIVFGDQGQVNHVVPASREFTIATGGTTERLRITSDGYLQQHKLIAVSYSDSRELAITDADLTTSNFYNETNFASDTSILDSNGHFVAPVHGIYRLYCRFTTDGDTGNRANVRLRKNGTTVNEAYANYTSGGINGSVSSEIIMELDANEYFDIQVAQLHTMPGGQHKVVNFHMLG